VEEIASGAKDHRPKRQALLKAATQPQGEVKPMMPFEHQVCSREFATRLAELGVGQESRFWWVDRKLVYTGGLASHAHLQGGVAAFTVAELGEMLPDDISIPAKNGKLHTHWLRFGRYRAAGPRFWCAYPGGTARTTIEERAYTEADARAKLLIYLLEHNLLSPTGLCS
jgi:hypothetical protein